MAIAEVRTTVIMICENTAGPYAYDIYAIKPSDGIKNIHGAWSSSSSRYRSSRYRYRSRSRSRGCRYGYRRRSRSRGYRRRSHSSGSRYGSRSRSSGSRYGYRSGSRSSGRYRSIPSPVYRMKRELYPYSMGFFSIGSKIYMVGGEQRCYDDDDVSSNRVSSNRVFVYDTLTSRVKEGPPMVSGKPDPVVIGPIEGKFYVLSYNLCYGHGFEVFDPDSRTWLLLPHPPSSVPQDPDMDYMETEGYAIDAHVVVGHTILLSTYGGCIFSFDVITHSWSEIRNTYLPFVGRAVFAADADDHRWYALSDDFDSDCDDFPLFAFHVLHHPRQHEHEHQHQHPNYQFVEAPIKKLQPPIGPICGIHRQGHVNYLGNQHLCITRSGYTGSPFYYERRPPKHYVTIDLFRIHSDSRHSHRSSSDCHLSAADHISLSFIMDDYYDGDDDIDIGRNICFSLPIVLS